MQPEGSVLLPSLAFQLLFGGRLNPCAAGDGLVATEPGEDLGNRNSGLRFHLDRFPKYQEQTSLFQTGALASRDPCPMASAQSAVVV